MDSCLAGAAKMQTDKRNHAVCQSKVLKSVLEQNYSTKLVSVKVHLGFTDLKDCTRVKNGKLKTSVKLWVTFCWKPLAWVLIWTWTNSGVSFVRPAGRIPARQRV